MAKITEGPARWSKPEWDAIGVALLDLHDKGIKPAQGGVYWAQLVALSPDRRRTREACDKQGTSGQPYIAVKRAKALTARQRVAIRRKFNALPDSAPAEVRRVFGAETAAPAPAPAPVVRVIPEGVSGKGRKPKVFWTPTEWALIARRVHHWQVDMKSELSLGRLMIDAQAIELPPSRHKSSNGLHQAANEGKALTLKKLTEGRKAADKLLAGRPFDYRATSYAAPVQAPAPLPPSEKSLGGDPGASAAAVVPTVQAQPAAGAGHASPVPVILAHIGAGLELLFGQLQQRAAAPAAAVLDAATVEAISQQVEARVMGQVHAAATAAARDVAAQLGQTIGETLRQVLIAEVGGPAPSSSTPSSSSGTGGSSTSTPESVAADAARAVQVMHMAETVLQQAPRRIKVDLVGLEYPDVARKIEDRYAGEIDLRLVHPDKFSSYAPSRGRECILLFDRVSHGLRNKLKKAGVSPLYIKGTEGHIKHALDELLRARNLN